MKPTRLRSLFQALRSTKRKGLIVLLDPDATDRSTFTELVQKCHQHQIFAFFIGGSHLIADDTAWLLEQIKPTGIPTLFFPHASFHLGQQADGFLLLSLVSGRNPEYLIGQHVVAAPFLRQSGMEVISTSYLLVGDDTQTTAAYMSQTQPIPASKAKIVVSTALAGELIGHHLTYLDAGSGAQKPVSAEVIAQVKSHVSLPLIVGGGIDSSLKAFDALQAGADAIVIGNALERDPSFLDQVAEVVQQYNQKLYFSS